MRQLEVAAVAALQKHALALREQSLAATLAGQPDQALKLAVQAEAMITAANTVQAVAKKLRDNA